MLIRDQLPVDLARSVTFSLVHSCIFASVIKNGVKCFLNLYSYSMDLFSYNCRACVSLGAREFQTPAEFQEHTFPPTDSEVLCTNWHLQALFHRTEDGTHSFTFLTQALS